MEEKIFVDGIFIELPSEKAPAFVKYKISYNAKKMIDWLQQHQNEKGWVNTTLLESRNGKLYQQLDTYKPSQEVKDFEKEVQEIIRKREEEPDERVDEVDRDKTLDDIPF